MWHEFDQYLLSDETFVFPLYTRLRPRFTKPIVIVNMGSENRGGADSERVRRGSINGSINSPAKVLSELTQRLHVIRTAIRDYERRFERERGRRPNASEKKADYKV
ncbi:unnamed protein product [Echinostoma caproni]|uniref:Transposase n=1 Tax=Echinostoma caproni TaxID=27848 RepID=A0A183B8I1_9TREM|nr:unnamed protein product [Echinostoma caproni]